MTQPPSPPPLPGPPSSPWKSFLVVAGAILLLGMVFGLSIFRMYGLETHHSSRSSIWWPERGRNLIPPGATDITLQRDLLDHYATYTISENDLNAFLDRRFAREGEVLDSFSERSRLGPESIGKAIGRLGWVVTEGTVVYAFTTSNGASSTFWHDPSSGRTYQTSAYW